MVPVTPARQKPEPSATLIAVGLVLFAVGGVIAAWGALHALMNPGADPATSVIGSLIGLGGWITAVVGIYRAAQALDYLVSKSL